MSNPNLAIDLNDVLERVQNDTELLVELLDIFMEDYKVKYIQLKEMIEKADFEQILNISHSLKGASGNISAVEFHRSFAAIEQYASEDNLDGIKEMFQRLEADLPNLQHRVAEIKAQYSAG